MPLADVEWGLDELRQRDLVEQLGGGLYRFRNALFLRWLRNNRSLMETVRQSREYKTPATSRCTAPAQPADRLGWPGAVGGDWRSDRGRWLRLASRETRIS